MANNKDRDVTDASGIETFILLLGVFVLVFTIGIAFYKTVKYLL